MNTEKKDLKLGELSDEDILSMDPDSFLEQVESEEAPVAEPTSDESAAEETEEAADTDETGGAVAEDQAEAEEDGGADTASADPFEGAGAEEPTDDEPEHTSEDHQSEDTGSEEAAAPETSSKELDYKAEFEKVMSPFKAYKRMIQPNSVDEVRQLMQKGADYARKMQDMKPYLRVFKTLERNELLDDQKINFLIELDKGNPDAIKKLLRDQSVDPMDVDLEEGTDWRPNDHMVGEGEIELSNVLDNIRENETFDRTVNVITKEWDKASQDELLDNPQVIQYINQHMETGIYDMVVDRMARERVFGRLDGLSDLEAYKTVGDAMFAEGAFNVPAPGTPSATGNTDQGPSQDGSKPSAKAEDLQNRKRAASPTKGSASPGKERIDLSKLSDDDILKLDPSSL